MDLLHCIFQGSYSNLVYSRCWISAYYLVQGLSVPVHQAHQLFENNYRKVPALCHLPRASYLLMQQEDQGRKLFKKVVKANFKKRNLSWNFYDGLMHNSQLLYLLSSHAPDALEDVSDNIIQTIANHLQNGNYNTLNSSYSIMALSAFSNATNEPSVGKINVSQILSNEQEKSLPLPAGKYPVVEFSDKADK